MKLNISWFVFGIFFMFGMNLSAQYCTPNCSNTADEWITNVTFNTINNTSGSTTYSDYTASQSTNVLTNASYNLEVSVTQTGTYPEYIRVWFDWNANNVFTDPGEEYDLGTSSLGSFTLSQSISIPSSATLGTTRMRVFLEYNMYPTSCKSTTYGEPEDYEIIILQGNDAESDIIHSGGFTEPSNIDYTLYNVASGLTTGSAIKVGEFTIRDGGSDNTDLDAKTTELSSITLDIDNFSGIQALAIFDGATNVQELTSVTSSNVFNAVSAISASDEGTKSFDIYATFGSTVTDNQNFKITISNATANASGSNFAQADAGGSSTDNSGDKNRIEVLASTLSLGASQPPSSVIVNENFIAQVLATDGNSNTDLDYVDAVTIYKNSGSGVLNLNGDVQNLVNGVYSWTTTQYNTVESFDIRVECASLTNVTSSSINCINMPVVTVGDAGDYNNIEDAYNSGIPATLTSPYRIEIRSDYNSANEILPITLSAKTGHSSLNYIQIRPQSGVTGLICSGNPGNGTYFMEINGASFITLDGRPGGTGSTRELLVRNTNTAGPGSTIAVTNGAENITLTYLDIEGETYAADGNGIVRVDGTGNSCVNIEISNNHLSDLTSGGSASLPGLGVYFRADDLDENDNCTVKENHFINIFKAQPSFGGVPTGAVYMVQCKNFRILDNHVYNTVSVSGLDFKSAWIGSINDNGNHVISGNFIGGSAPNCGGSPLTITSGTVSIYGIHMNHTNNGDSIYNNTISNISYTTTSTVAENPLGGIVLEGTVNYTVGYAGNGNTISNVTLTNNAASGSTGFSAIRNQASGVVNIVGNTISGIQVNGSWGSSHSYMIESTAGTVTINNNIIGAVVSNDISVTNGNVRGIAGPSGGDFVANNNIIRNIQATSSTGLFRGIFSTAGIFTAKGNLIHDINIDGVGTHYLFANGSGTSNAICTNNTVHTTNFTGSGVNALIGFYHNSSGTCVADSNKFGNLNNNNMVASGNTGSYGFYLAGSGSKQCNYNTIQEFNLTNTGSSNIFIAIKSFDGTTEIKFDTIRNIDLAGTGTGYNLEAFDVASTSSGHSIMYNTVTNLNATTTAAAMKVRGCVTAGSGNCEKNLFRDFTNKGPGGEITGYYVTSSSLWDLENNVILFDNGINTNDLTIYGIAVGSGNQNYYHNTIRIGGSTSSGTANTFAIYQFNANTYNYKNNIFQNVRTGGTGKHYAVAIGSNGTQTWDYNYIESLNASTVGSWLAVDKTFAAWKTSSGGSNSLNGTESIETVNGFATVSFVGNSTGTDLFSSVPDDILDLTRTTTPWMGAHEGSCAPLNGTYTIGGATPNYTTFGLAISDLNTCAISGPVKFNVRNGTYNEQITIGSVSGTNTTDTIVFQSEGKDSTLVTINYNGTVSDNYTIKMNNADFVSLKQITVEALNTTYGRAIDLTGGTNDSRIVNCELIGISTSSNSVDLYVLHDGLASNENNIHILNNRILNGSNGITKNGISPASLETGNVIKGNKCTDQYERGTAIANGNSTKVVNNDISTNSVNSAYIGVETAFVDNDFIVANNTVNISSAAGEGVRIQNCDASSGNEALIANNMIASPNLGINMISNSFINVYHNSVDASGVGIQIDNSSTDVNFANNISVSNGGSYAFSGHSVSFGTLDNNCYYTTGGNLAFWNSVAESTLSDFKSASGKNVNSISVNPKYNSSTDLHLSGASPSSLGTGSNLISVVSLDIDNYSRDTSPWMGADEISKLYWVGNGGNWNDNSHWSTSSGGSSCTCLPSSITEIVFDANSLSGSGQVITVPAGTWSGKQLGFLDQSKTPVIKGSGSIVLGQ